MAQKTGGRMCRTRQLNEKAGPRVSKFPFVSTDA